MPDMIVHINGEDEPRRFSGDVAQVKNALDQKYAQVRTFASTARGDVDTVLSKANREITDPENRRILASLMLRSNPIESVRSKIQNFMDYAPFQNPLEGGPEISMGDIARTGIDFVPGLGDVKSGAEAVEYAKEGRPGMAALSGLGALPLIPSVAGMIGKGVDKVPVSHIFKGEKPVVLAHDSPQSDPFTVRDEGLFGGIFAGPEGGMGGEFRHSVVLDENDILTHGEYDYLDWDKKVDSIKKHARWLSDPDDIDLMDDIISEGKSVYDLDPGDLERLFRTDDYADASFNSQRLRGRIAKDFGFKAVEMKDETGISTLVLPGVEVLPLLKGESIDDATRRIFTEIGHE